MELLSVTMNDGVKPRSEIEGKDNSSEDKSNYKIVRKGDMVYNSMRMWQGANGISPCDGIVSPAYTVLMPKQEINNGYFAALFKSANLINEFRKNSQGMTSDTWNLKYPQIETIKIQIPSVSEQDKVSELFGVLDARIVAQAQLIEALKKYKRGSLSALFPKKGEITPQYRFAGFTKPWEQRKLGDVFTERTERANGDEELLSVTIGNGVIRQVDSDKRNIASEDKSNYKIVHKGDVPYNSMRMWQGAVGNSEYDGIVSPAYTVLVPSKEANGKFFMELFKKESTLKIFQRWSQGLTSDTWNLKYPVLSTIEISIPRIEEQKRISDYFATLDHLITLHQHKYDTLLSLKNAILQQMFI